MQQDRDVLDALRTDLAELTALHAPSGLGSSDHLVFPDQSTRCIDKLYL